MSAQAGFDHGCSFEWVFLPMLGVTNGGGQRRRVYVLNFELISRLVVSRESALDSYTAVYRFSGMVFLMAERVL